MKINMSVEQRNMYSEQLRVSEKAIQLYQHDPTPEGKKEFYKHAEIINQIKTRLDIAVSSQEGAKRISDILAKL